MKMKWPYRSNNKGGMIVLAAEDERSDAHGANNAIVANRTCKT